MPAQDMGLGGRERGSPPRSPRSRSGRRFRDRIEAERNPAGELVLALGCERMELCAMCIAQQALQSGIAIEAGAAPSGQSSVAAR